MTPSQSDDFLVNLENLRTAIRAEEPYASFFVGDFNAHCQYWWPDGETNEEELQIDRFREECFKATENAKKQHLNDMGKIRVENQSSSKAYWKIFSKLINKAINPRIPLILYENKFVVNCIEKACLFN